MAFIVAIGFGVTAVVSVPAIGMLALPDPNYPQPGIPGPPGSCVLDCGAPAPALPAPAIPDPAPQPPPAQYPLDCARPPGSGPVWTAPSTGPSWSTPLDQGPREAPFNVLDP
ncbi:hypothetical protein [Nocardia inohanensis]|uniref:hypothetical protein n=1 Tax=Nocardia inohanensis TaxID=209246 RepID=UPI00083260F4|nr:hypothetical protein [Nocardia inohanensis]